MNAQTVRSLLDREQAARLLRRLCPEAGTRELSIESVWAKPGRHFNVTYRPAGETSALASLCVVSESEAAKASRSWRSDSAARRRCSSAAWRVAWSSASSRAA